jgi:hypothetical protein
LWTLQALDAQTATVSAEATFGRVIAELASELDRIFARRDALAVLLDRPDSLPGRKDRIEILALLADPSTATTPQIIADASTRSADQQRVLLGKAFEFLAADPSVNRAGRDRLRRTSNAWLRDLPTPPGVANGPSPDL